MPKAKRIRRKRNRLASQNQLPLSLTAVGILVYGVMYWHIGMWFVITFPGFKAPLKFTLEFSSLAIQLCLVHGGWLVLLLLNLLAVRTPKSPLLTRHSIGEWCAIAVATALLASSLQMIAATPSPTDQAVFEFEFDHEEGVWTLQPNK